MTIQWFGHACFLVTAKDGTRIITDPFDATVGYKVPNVEADIVTISHDHFDHNAVNLVKGKPQVIKGSGEHEAKGIKFTGISTFHDTSSGSQRGRNIIYVFEVDGMTVCHLGDLGHPLEHRQVEHIGAVDILLIPVGGVFTIDARTADEAIAKIRPRIVIPMHYRTALINFPIDGVDEFLAGKTNVEKVDSNQFEITKEELPRETTIVVLNYE